MEHIDNQLQKALATLGRLTKEAQLSTPAQQTVQLPDPEPFFEKFQTFGESSLSQVKKAATRFCLDMAQGDTQRWLTLCGPSATGKTLTARSVRKYHGIHIELGRDEAGYPLVRRSMFLEWGRALTWMVEGDYSFLRDVADCHFLVLDDIGAEYSRLRELSTSKLYEVLCSRRYKHTLITANLSLQQIAASLDQRIASRLLRDGSEVVEVDAPDYNLR